MSRRWTAQLNWFANHPDFLERTFGRAELWLLLHRQSTRTAQYAAESWRCCRSSRALSNPTPTRAPALRDLWQFISDTGSSLRSEAGLVV